MVNVHLHERINLQKRENFNEKLVVGSLSVTHSRRVGFVVIFRLIFDF